MLRPEPRAKGDIIRMAASHHHASQSRDIFHSGDLHFLPQNREAKLGEDFRIRKVALPVVTAS